MSTEPEPTVADRSPAAYRWGAIGPAHVTPWSRLTNLLAEADQTEEFCAPEDLAEELQESGVNPELDLWSVWEGEEMVGFGQLRVADRLDSDGRVRIFLGGGVHPQHRDRGIGRALMDRLEQRGAELAAERHPGVPAYWRADGGLEGASARRLLEHRGYRIVRYFNQMTRHLPGARVAVATDGVELRAPEQEMESALREAHNLAFADHWGSTAQSEEGWHDHWTARSNRFAVSTVALDATGGPLAYVLCGEWVPRELYVNLVGTVPEARGRGLARACLARTIDVAGASGDYDVVDLHVDSASPTGATRLYEAVGFALKKTFATYQRDAGAGQTRCGCEAGPPTRTVET